jgi:hypothetical protein
MFNPQMKQPPWQVQWWLPVKHVNMVRMARQSPLQLMGWCAGKKILQGTLGSPWEEDSITKENTK